MPELEEWFNWQIDGYAMLLCRERYDFTVFHLYEKMNPNPPKIAARELIEVLKNRGKILSIEKDSKKGVVFPVIVTFFKCAGTKVIQMKLREFMSFNNKPLPKTTIEKIPDTIFELSHIYDVYQVDLSGAQRFTKGIIKQIQEKEMLKYNENKLTIKCI